MTSSPTSLHVHDVDMARAAFAKELREDLLTDSSDETVFEDDDDDVIDVDADVEDDDDDEDDEDDSKPDPLMSFIDASFVDVVVRGKELDGTTLRDIARVTSPEEEAPYTYFLLQNEDLATDPIGVALQTFLVEHASRLQNWRAESPILAEIMDAFENSLVYVELDSSTATTRQFLITYTDDDTVSGCFRQAVCEVPRVSDTVLSSLWYAHNVRIAFRQRFYAAALRMCAEKFARSDMSLYDLSVMVSLSFVDGGRNKLAALYTQACTVVDGFMARGTE